MGILGFYLIKPVFGFINDPEGFKTWIEILGLWAPIAMISIQILQVVIAPIPGQIIGVLSGYTFGVFWGSIYTIIGTLIGSYFLFLAARKFGRPLVEKIVKPRTLSKIDSATNDGGIFALFILWLLPFIPDDIMCLGAGLTTIRIKTLMIMAFLGRLPGLIILNMAGAGFAEQNANISFIILILIAVASFLIFKYKNQLEKLSTKLIDKWKAGK
ncbi:MAG TPA: TVP38/TMEM64 family protein [Candidatus Paceibacterota bacterium]